MKRKLLFFATLCFVFFASCSAEDVNHFTSRPVNVANPSETDYSDTIGKPGLIDNPDPDSAIIDGPIVIKNNIVAHRGAWKKNNLPQNSIASLKEAIRLKCRGSEFDLWLTADDSLVICHDNSYNNLNIQNSNYSQLVVFKLSNGEKLPTLREYIQAAKQNNNTTQLFCHVKDLLSAARRKVYATKILECVNKLNAQPLIVYASENYNILKELRALSDSADIRSFLTNVTLSPEEVKKDNISGIFYYDYVYYKNPDWIERARLNNISLSVSVINNADGINWFLKNKFDAILSDEPELALNLQDKL
ncbi:glycerophosphodiester phosphodiesterase family protein [Flavobacterium denitrificans]|uniref:glycerophosphodiester phosphodiesterase family protein n=1 Tax=Flavobacterium denitrificans TaxID=281361 RepID=UPI000412E009|nr:glycerophosphodiester phosphodiesterase family protein [Flavobacterium denitrificans]